MKKNRLQIVYGTQMNGTQMIVRNFADLPDWKKNGKTQMEKHLNPWFLKQREF